VIINLRGVNHVIVQSDLCQVGRIFNAGAFSDDFRLRDRPGLPIASKLLTTVFQLNLPIQDEFGIRLPSENQG
jgi:hypothetical protein